MTVRISKLAMIAVFIAARSFDASTATDMPITWSLDPLPPKPIRAGSHFVSKVVAHLQAGWHLYALEEVDGGPVATDISLLEGSVFNLESVRGPKPILLLDPNFGKRVGFYVDKAEFLLSLGVSSTAPKGQHRLAIQVRYQCCNQSMCLSPKKLSVQSDVTVQ